MCVIFVATEGRPTEDDVRAAYDVNPSGGGIAWRDGGQIHWKKGLSVEDMIELCHDRPIPWVAHFRIPSCGGPSKRLCHPFLIDRKGSAISMEGSTKGEVLFHNGHWNKWEDILLQAVFTAKLQLPNDRWSDSRALAFLAGHFGHGMLELPGEKIVAFGPETLELFGAGWTKAAGFYRSNEHWTHRVNHWRHTRKEEPEDETYINPPRSMFPHERRALPPVEQPVGGGATGSPFVQNLRGLKLQEVINLLAEGKVSKKQFKKFKKKWDHLQAQEAQQEHHNRVAEAQAQLDNLMDLTPMLH